MALYTYDIEVGPNLILILFKDIATGQIWKFKQTKNKSNFDKFKEFITQQDLSLVGFNNYRYDDSIMTVTFLHKIFTTYLNVLLKIKLHQASKQSGMNLILFLLLKLFKVLIYIISSEINHSNFLLLV